MRRFLVVLCLALPALCFAGVAGTAVGLIESAGASCLLVLGKLGSMYAGFLLIARVLRRFGLILDGKPARSGGGGGARRSAGELRAVAIAREHHASRRISR